jgi:hypothetical protein
MESRYFIGFPKKKTKNRASAAVFEKTREKT